MIHYIIMNNTLKNVSFRFYNKKAWHFKDYKIKSFDFIPVNFIIMPATFSRYFGTLKLLKIEN